MDQYQINLAALGVLCLVLLASQPTRVSKLQKTDKKDDDKKTAAAPVSPKHPQRDFYVVYALAFGADWLQGPYLYSLYRDQYGLAASVVSTLFTTGFVSGAVSGVFVGALADRWGRKRACLAFCGLYGASALLTTAGPHPVPLFAGRALGGVATSILFSVFDSWMVADFRRRRLVDHGCDLSRTYGTMGTINSLAAIAAGVASEALVAATGSKKAPFYASSALLWLALQRIFATWGENFGHSGTAPTDKDKTVAQPSVYAVLKRPAVLALVFGTTMFEGSMYLFVFFWVPALQAAQRRPTQRARAGAGESSPPPPELPYGVIFACFMACVMAASLGFNLVMQRRLVRYSSLFVGLLVAANWVFVKLAGPRTEVATFWLFCLFEACVGLYWPCTGYLKGRLIDDGVRAKVYSLMRVPLNLFVVAAMILTRETGNFTQVFAACSMFLTVAFGAVWGSTWVESVP